MRKPVKSRTTSTAVARTGSTVPTTAMQYTYQVLVAKDQELIDLRRAFAELQADRDSLARTVARQAREIAQMKGETE